MPSETDQISQPGDEKQLCVSCMFPNEPAANFCAKCGAPLTSYAATGPFEHLFAEGHVYRQAAEKPRSLVVVLGIWLIFGMMALGGVVFIALGRSTGLVSAVVGTFLLAIAVVMIWKTTRNYLARGRKDEKHDG